MTINEFLRNLDERGYKVTYRNLYGSYEYNVYFDNIVIARIDTDGSPAITLYPFMFSYSSKLGASSLSDAAQEQFNYDISYLNSLIKYDKYESDGELIFINTLIIKDGLLDKCFEYILYCVEMYEKQRGVVKSNKFKDKINKAKNKV